MPPLMLQERRYTVIASFHVSVEILLASVKFPHSCTPPFSFPLPHILPETFTHSVYWIKKKNKIMNFKKLLKLLFFKIIIIIYYY